MWHCQRVYFQRLYQLTVCHQATSLVEVVVFHLLCYPISIPYLTIFTTHSTQWHCRNRLAAVSDEDNYNESSYIDTPALRPISPPRHQSSTNPNNNTTSSALYNVPAEDNEDSDESDTDMHTNSVAPYGGSSYNGHGSSNPNIHYVSASGAGGAGGGGSGGKKGKKGKKSTTSSGNSGKYNGLEEALQLPKIGATGSAVRRK